MIILVCFNCLQQKLNELSQWREKIQQCEPTLITNNRLFAVTCSYFHHSVSPELDYICRRTYELVAVQNITEAQQLTDDLHQIVQVLKLTAPCVSLHCFRHALKTLFFQMYAWFSCCIVPDLCRKSFNVPFFPYLLENSISILLTENLVHFHWFHQKFIFKLNMGNFSIYFTISLLLHISTMDVYRGII